MSQAPGGQPRAEVIRIDGPSGVLEGTTVVIEGARHAVVILPGSGPTDRDGNRQDGARSDTYRLLAEGLAEARIASIRIDKRGLGGSAGAPTAEAPVTVNDLARDAREWVRAAARLAPVVWLAGHSEGGLVALLAAQRPPSALRGLILMAAPGRRVGVLLREQMRASPVAAPLATQIDTIVGALESGRTWPVDQIPGPLRDTFRIEAQALWIDLLSHDPARLAARWRGPALVIQGDCDLQVGAVDAARLAAAIAGAERLDLPGGAHMLKACVPGAPLASYADPTLPLHPALVPGIAAYLKRH